MVKNVLQLKSEKGDMHLCLTSSPSEVPGTVDLTVIRSLYKKNSCSVKAQNSILETKKHTTQSNLHERKHQLTDRLAVNTEIFLFKKKKKVQIKKDGNRNYKVLVSLFDRLKSSIVWITPVSYRASVCSGTTCPLKFVLQRQYSLLNPA